MPSHNKGRPKKDSRTSLKKTVDFKNLSKAKKSEYRQNLNGKKPVDLEINVELEIPVEVAGKIGRPLVNPDKVHWLNLRSNWPTL